MLSLNVCRPFGGQLVAAALCAVLAACGGGGGRDPILGTGGATQITPRVTAVTPAADSSNVAVNTRAVTATFSEPMDPASLTAASFTLACPAGTPVQATVSYQATSRIATLVPASNLPAGTTCVANISTAAMDLLGNRLLAPFTWRFATGAAPDTTAPLVSSLQPGNNATNVPVNAVVAVGFSEPLDPMSVTAASLTLACPTGAAIGGAVAYSANGNAITFTPTSNLPATTTCAATVGNNIRDVAGNPIASAMTINFTTGTAPDTVAPTVSSVFPAAGATAVAINSVITASFSESMSAASLTASSFTLACPTNSAVTGTVSYTMTGNVARLTPSSNLPAGVTCTAQITTAARDLAGNALASPFTWSFTTGAAPDTTAPTVTAVTPAAGATGVALNALVTASFSEAMDPASLSTASFTLACPAGSAITGTVGYAANSNTATFTPAANLPAGVVCSAMISTAARDAAGNPLASAFSWTFTTGAAPDTTRPTVLAVLPAANTSGVAVNTQVSLRFSEAMDPASLDIASFTLDCPTGSNITGTVAYAVSSSTATFSPGSNLPASTTCTVMASPAVRDVAGNTLAAAFNSSFTTGAAPDTTAPTVLSTNPADGAVGVCRNKTLNATFSEAMDALTINTATLTLRVSGGATVTGVVSYDSASNIASFNPESDLIGTPATSYVATIRGGAAGVKDIAGNALTTDRVTQFSTNASLCTSAPPLGAAAPFGAFSGATVTNDGLNTVINGDIGVDGASTSITGFRDSGGNVYTVTPDNDGRVNGLVYTLSAPPGSVAGATVTAARADALQAFNALSPANLPGGVDVSNLAQCPSCGGAGGGPDELAGRVLPPGIYLSATGSYDIGGAGRTTASLTLDAGGDADAVWVFQTAAGTGTLNVGLVGPATPAVPIQVLLINGAQPRNVFWFVPGGAVIGTGSTVVGTLLADAANTFSTTGGSPPTAVLTTLNGRAVSLSAGLTMTNTRINVPAP